MRKILLTMLSEKLKIRVAIFYEFKLGTKAPVVFDKLCKVFGPNCVTDRTVRNLYSKFRSGDFNLEDKPRSGRPRDIDLELLDQVISEDPTKTCSSLAIEFEVNKETIRKCLHKLGKKWRLSKWVPYELTESQKLNRLTTCSCLLSKHENGVGL